MGIVNASVPWSLGEEGATSCEPGNELSLGGSGKGAARSAAQKGRQDGRAEHMGQPLNGL